MRPLLVAVMLLVLLGPAKVSGYTKAYDVVPFRNCVATAPPDAEVTQYYRNTLDSMSRVSVWVCEPDTHGFHVEIRDSAPPSPLIAHGDTAARADYCGWLDFEPTKDVEPVRGRTYKVVVSRTSGKPISYSYCDTNPYAYGMLVVPGQQPPVPLNWDLALRVYGRKWGHFYEEPRVKFGIR